MQKYTLPKPSAEKLAQTCLFAGGHLLIEDIPGTGKTVLAKKIANISKFNTAAGCKSNFANTAGPKLEFANTAGSNLKQTLPDKKRKHC